MYACLTHTLDLATTVAPIKYGTTTVPEQPYAIFTPNKVWYSHGTYVFLTGATKDLPLYSVSIHQSLGLGSATGGIFDISTACHQLMYTHPSHTDVATCTN